MKKMGLLHSTVLAGTIALPALAQATVDTSDSVAKKLGVPISLEGVPIRIKSRKDLKAHIEDALSGKILDIHKRKEVANAIITGCGFPGANQVGGRDQYVDCINIALNNQLQVSSGTLASTKLFNSDLGNSWDTINAQLPATNADEKQWAQFFAMKDKLAQSDKVKDLGISVSLKAKTILGSEYYDDAPFIYARNQEKGLGTNLASTEY